MKSIASTAFFRLFDRAVRPADVLNVETKWLKDGVEWTHVRHSFRGVDHGFSVDVYTGTKSGKRGWSMMVVREGWWLTRKNDPVRTSQWAHLMSGNRTDAMAWFDDQKE